jgi:hypothetical protein
LRDEAFGTRTRARSLKHPVRAAEDIYRISREMFKAEDLGGLKVRLIGVGVAGFEEDGQLSLFETPDAAQHKVDRVMADIRQRFGKTAITRASLAERPEKKHRAETQS